MINLLPPEAKAQLRAARTNRLLLRYNILLAVAFVFLLSALGIVYMYLTNTKAAAEETIALNRARASDYAAIQSQAADFRTNLTNAKQILDGDIAYTKVILAISQVLPSGVVLDTLALDSKAFGNPTTLTAKVKDYPTVLTLKNSLQNSTLFENVSIQSISGGNDGPYPLTVILSVTIKKDAAQ
jgi:Tfp pilus assembly protein PilN